MPWVEFANVFKHKPSLKFTSKHCLFTIDVCRVGSVNKLEWLYTFVYTLYPLFRHYPNDNLQFPFSFITYFYTYIWYFLWFLFACAFYFVFKLDPESSELDCSWPHVTATMWELITLWKWYWTDQILRQHDNARYLLWIMAFFGVVIFFYINVCTCCSRAWSLKEIFKSDLCSSCFWE
jgi:hypothetical protein